MGVRGETCFELEKPIIGKPPGRVCVSEFGEIRVEHRLLKVPITFSTDRVLTVIEASESVRDEIPALEREPTAIHLPRDAFTPANFGFVFRSPVRVGPFKLGSQQLIPLKRNERRSGIDVDLVALNVEEPQLLGHVLRGAGVSSSDDVGASLARAIPMVPPELEAAVLERRRRGSRGAAWKILGLGLFIAGSIGARVAAESSWETMSRLVLASLGAATLSGMAVAITRPSPRGGPVRRWTTRIALGVGLLVLLGAAIDASDQVSGTRYVLLWACFAGLLASPLVAGGLRGLAATEPDPPAPDPLAGPSRRSWTNALAVAALATLAVGGSAAMEEAAARPIRQVKGALVDAEDLPQDWSQCCGGDHIFRGDSLDQHICGGDDNALPSHVAGVARSFNDLTPGHPDLSEAHVDVGVFLAATDADAQAEFAAVNSPDYMACTETSIGKRASEFQPGATDLAGVEFLGRETLPGVEDLVIDRFAIRIPVSGTFDAIAGQFIRARVGRAILRMPMLEYVPGALPTEERDAIVLAALEKVRSAEL